MREVEEREGWWTVRWMEIKSEERDKKMNREGGRRAGEGWREFLLESWLRYCCAKVVSVGRDWGHVRHSAGTRGTEGYKSEANLLPWCHTDRTVVKGQFEWPCTQRLPIRRWWCCYLQWMKSGTGLCWLNEAASRFMQISTLSPAMMRTAALFSSSKICRCKEAHRSSMKSSVKTEAATPQFLKGHTRSPRGTREP